VLGDEVEICEGEEVHAFHQRDGPSYQEAYWIASGFTDQGADVGAALDEVLDDMAADGAGRAGNENGHGVAMRNALSGVSTLFLLNAVVPDEVTQALIALNLALRDLVGHDCVQQEQGRDA
jgi:hypothetical protein